MNLLARIKSLLAEPEPSFADAAVQFVADHLLDNNATLLITDAHMRETYIALVKKLRPMEGGALNVASLETVGAMETAIIVHSHFDQALLHDALMTAKNVVVIVAEHKHNSEVSELEYTRQRFDLHEIDFAYYRLAENPRRADPDIAHLEIELDALCEQLNEVDVCANLTSTTESSSFGKPSGISHLAS